MLSRNTGNNKKKGSIKVLTFCPYFSNILKLL